MNLSKDPLVGQDQRAAWCEELQRTWYQNIPLSEKAGIRVERYTGEELVVLLPGQGNQNPHQTLFAGSLFILASLAGWGLVWLLMKEQGHTGTIVLGDAHIRYGQPLVGQAIAVASRAACRGRLQRLASGSKASVHLQIALTDRDRHQSKTLFEGAYVVIPAAKPTDGQLEP